MPDQGLSNAFPLMRGACRNWRKQVGFYRLIESKACEKYHCYQLCIITGTNSDDLIRRKAKPNMVFGLCLKICQISCSAVLQRSRLAPKYAVHENRVRDDHR